MRICRRCGDELASNEFACLSCGSNNYDELTPPHRHCWHHRISKVKRAPVEFYVCCWCNKVLAGVSEPVVRHGPYLNKEVDNGT